MSGITTHYLSKSPPGECAAITSLLSYLHLTLFSAERLLSLATVSFYLLDI